MKNSLLIALFALVSTTAAHAASPDKTQVLTAFFAAMPSLKLADGSPVADAFSADMLEHFSGSTGNRLKIDACEDYVGKRATCDVNVLIYFGHHGEENGITQTVTYQLGVLENGKISDVSRIERQ
jgi:hypothetical protein